MSGTPRKWSGFFMYSLGWASSALALKISAHKQTHMYAQVGVGREKREGIWKATTTIIG